MRMLRATMRLAPPRGSFRRIASRSFIGKVLPVLENRAGRATLRPPRPAIRLLTRARLRARPPIPLRTGYRPRVPRKAALVLRTRRTVAAPGAKPTLTRRRFTLGGRIRPAPAPPPAATGPAAAPPAPAEKPGGTGTPTQTQRA